MIFALETDTNTLKVFPSAKEAIDYCEGIDVEDGGWRFWDETGMALMPEFLVPNERGKSTVCSGTYRLVPAPRGLPLSASIPAIDHLQSNPYFASVPSLLAYLQLRLTRPGIARKQSGGITP